MSTSMLFHAFGISNVIIYRTEYPAGKIAFHGEVKDRLLHCPECRSRKVIKFGHTVRQIRLIPLGMKPTFLYLTTYRVKCQECGQIRWIHLPFVQGKSNCSRSFTRFMLALCQKMTIQDATELLHVSWDLVKDHHKDHLRKIYRKRDWKRLKYLGIDEFSVKKGHKYLTIAVDLEVGDIIFANEGKSKETLIPLLLKLKRFSQSLQAIAIDMSPAFIEAIMEYLPHEISQFANSAYPWNLKLLRP